jgi:two-component system, sensor histidine kinase and response regulator
MDCHMPGTDGYEAAAEIRKRERGSRHTPIIAMTAAATKEDRERALDAGMDDFVAKPVHVEQLAAVLRRWTGEESEMSERRPSDEEVRPQGTQVVDQHRLAELQELGTGSDLDVLGELVDLFVRGTLEILPRLQKAVAERDASALEEAAHSLKGAAANIGAGGMVSLCAELEAIGRSGSPEMQGAPELTRRLTKEFHRVRDAIQAEVQPSS